METLGKRIVSHRKRLGLTQDQLAPAARQILTVDADVSLGAITVRCI